MRWRRKRDHVSRIAHGGHSDESADVNRQAYHGGLPLGCGCAGESRLNLSLPRHCIFHVDLSIKRSELFLTKGVSEFKSGEL